MVREILLKTLRYYCTRPRGRAIEQHSLSLIALIIVDVLAFIASRLITLVYRLVVFARTSLHAHPRVLPLDANARLIRLLLIQMERPS